METSHSWGSIGEQIGPPLFSRNGKKALLYKYVDDCTEAKKKYHLESYNLKHEIDCENNWSIDNNLKFNVKRT